MTNVSMPDNTASLLQRINFNMPVLSYGRDINNESSTIRNAFQSSIVSYGTVEPNILWNNMNEFQQKISNTFPFQSNTFLTLQNVQQKQLLTSFQQTHQISVTDKSNPMAPVSDASNRMRRKGGRDKRHWAWQFFNTGEPSENGGPPSAQCKLCESIIKWAGSTNIGKHLRRRHKDIFQDESIKTEIVTSPLNSTADNVSMAPSIASQLNNNKLTDIKVNNCTTSVIKKEVISRSESPVITNNIKPINRIQNNNIQSLINSTSNNNTSITNSVGAANICNLINSKRSGISLSRRYLALYHAAYPLGNVENEFFKKFCSLINAELPDKRTLNLDALNEITAIIDDGKAMLGMLSELTISMNVVMYNDKPMCAYFAHFLHPAENKPVVLALRVISYDAVPKAKDLKKDLDSIMKFYDISDSILSYVILNCGYQLMTQLQDLPLTTQAEQNRVLMEVLANLLRATTSGENLEDVCNSISTMETESNNNYEDKEDGGKKQSNANNLIYKKRFHYNVQLDECYDLFGKERFYKCSAHQLFEIIEMAIEKFDRLKKLREKVLELLALLYQSPVAICTLSKMGITNIPFPTDSSWNSVLIAYNALVEYQTYVQINTVADGQGWKTLSEEDIKLMSEYVEIFTKCNEYLDMIQNGTASYISMIYPTLHAILNHLKKDLWSYLNDVPKVLEKDIRETFKDILESGKGDIKDHIFIVASLLDRRASWLLTDDEKKLAMSTTLTLIQKNKSKCATIDSSEDGSQMDSNDINQQLFGQSSLALSSLIHNSPFKDLVQDRFTNSSIEMSIDTPEKEELIRYTREWASQPVGSDYTSMQFWTSMGWSFPNLNTIASSLLVIPSTATTFENIINEDTGSVSSPRNSNTVKVSEETMNRRVIVACNKWLITL